MTRREKKKLQSDFLRKAGPNAATFKAVMDALPEVAFYMKDAEGRIMALNRRNCDICNIHDELDAVSDAFYDVLASLEAGENNACEAAYDRLEAHLHCVDDMEQITLGAVF